jgi:pimeloyl-ACP methyl ester carboxylesterase
MRASFRAEGDARSSPAQNTLKLRGFSDDFIPRKEPRVADMYAVLSRPGPVEASILSDLSATFTVKRVVSSPITLRVLEGGPKDAGAEIGAPPLVLLHGRGHAATMWFPLLPELARRRRVIAVDLPGFGHSSARPFTGGPEEAVRFFVDPIEAMLASYKVTTPVLIGHSLGGLIASEIALRGAISPSRLVLIGSMGLGPSMTYASRAFFRAVPERLARLTGPRIMNLFSPAPNTPAGKRASALEYELYNVRGGRPEAAAAFNALFPSIGPAFHRLDRLRQIACPALLLWGEKDQAFPPETAVRAASVMRDATVRIEPLGHSPHLEDPDRALAAILEFIGGCDRPSPRSTCGR